MKRAKKKSRISSKSNHRGPVLALVIMAIIALSYAVYRKIDLMRSADREKSIRLILTTLDSYYQSTASKKSDTWWLETAPLPGAESFTLLEARKNKIETMIRESERISDLTKVLSSRFRSVGLGLMVNGEPRQLNKVGSVPTSPTNRIDICIIPKDGPTIHGSAMPYWDPRRELLMIPAINCPDPILKEILFHELGHASRHNALDGNPYYPPTSEAYAAEEVEMHELGGQILDFESKGLYLKRIREVVVRAKNLRSFEKAIGQLNSKDLAYIDALFGCTDLAIPSFQLSSQALLQVGFAWCDEHHLGPKEKIKIYQWFGQNIASVPLN